MTCLARSAAAALLAGASLLLPGGVLAAPPDACAATARTPPGDPRIARAVDLARQEHQRFGRQTVDRDGSLIRAGVQEAESGRLAGGGEAAWQRVAAYWQSLDAAQPPTLRTSLGRVERQLAWQAVAAALPAGTPEEAAVRESLLRAALLDTPWSAAFISHLMKEAGLSGAEFAFSDSHVDYVQAAFAASEAEAQGQAPGYAFRACDVARTRPRAGDLLCATRAASAAIQRFDALREALRARAPGQGFPMHCDLVVRADEGGDAKIEVIGGNVLNSVTLARMTLDARKRLSAGYHAQAGQPRCAPQATGCREHLTRRPWAVLLQFRLSGG